VSDVPVQGWDTRPKGQNEPLIQPNGCGCKISTLIGGVPVGNNAHSIYHLNSAQVYTPDKWENITIPENECR